MEKNISYLSRTFTDYRQALIDFTKKYYPDLSVNVDDASVMSWLIDLNAAVADELSYHIDRVFQETDINSAQESSSVFAMARSNGFKIPGPKGAMAEVKFSCQVPANGDEPNYTYAPILRRGTKVEGLSQVFELLNDVDFSKQFDENGQSDRTIIPVRNTNGQITQYKLEKLAVVTAGETKIYRQVLYSRDIKPFMEIVLPYTNVMNIESIVVQDGTSIQSYPKYSAFYSQKENVCQDATGVTMTRFFEVDSLAQQDVWGEAVDKDAENFPIIGENNEKAYVTKGEWKRVKHKFITEYTDKGYLKIIFGGGMDPNVDSVEYSTEIGMSKYLISKSLNNTSLGYLPTPNSTLFVLYRVGGGKASNLAKGVINNITMLNCDFNGDISAAQRSTIIKTIRVENTTPSVSGKDMPTTEELKYLIKYNNGAQNRCVTIKDYLSRLEMLPPKYGTPFRVGGKEENNKIMLYLLGLDENGKLSQNLPLAVVSNIKEYLSGYRMINDYIELKPGKIINLKFEIDMFVDRSYNRSDVIADVIDTVREYMDIEKHNMGDDLYVGDLQKEITKREGVLGVIDLRVRNITGTTDTTRSYSTNTVTQETMENETESSGTEQGKLIDLDASEGIIYSDNDSMLEIKYPEKDIICRVKVR